MYGHTYVKDGISLKIKILHMQLYFIATQYLWRYALVEDIDVVWCFRIYIQICLQVKHKFFFSDSNQPIISYDNEYIVLTWLRGGSVYMTFPVKYVATCLKQLKLACFVDSI